MSTACGEKHNQKLNDCTYKDSLDNDLPHLVTIANKRLSWLHDLPCPSSNAPYGLVWDLHEPTKLKILASTTRCVRIPRPEILKDTWQDLSWAFFGVGTPGMGCSDCSDCRVQGVSTPEIPGETFWLLFQGRTHTEGRELCASIIPTLQPNLNFATVILLETAL